MPEHRYTYRSMHREREYGPYWYSGLWQVLRPVLVAVTALVIVAGLVLTGWNRIYAEYLAPVDSADRSEVAFTVTSGQSLTGVANHLEEAGLVRSRTVFKYYCDFAGFSQKLQPGDYRLTRAMTMNEIADRLTRGDGSPLVRTITLIPGWTVEDFAAYLVEEGVLADAETLLSLCRGGEAFSDYYDISTLLAAGVQGRRYALEGYLAPDTYEIYTDAAPESILRKLLTQTERRFTAEMQDRAEELGITMDQALTLASLIEKEAKTADFARVSAVFHGRLQRGMRLQSDVTIHYITGVRRMSLPDSDLNLDSPYNTYRYNGLPVGPVCNPSTDAINAALWPDEAMLAEGYLYFCAKDPESGELYFSRTLEEHEMAVSVYAPLWQAYDAARGL